MPASETECGSSWRSGGGAQAGGGLVFQPFTAVRVPGVAGVAGVPPADPDGVPQPVECFR